MKHSAGKSELSPTIGEIQASGANAALADLRRRIRAGRRLALAKACCAAAGLRVHDAMAGWGTDGLVLAGLGCKVHMSERVPDIHGLLIARVAEAAAQLRFAHEITCACEDARTIWSAPPRFDVIYLDPMFPPHHSSAASGKRMRAVAELAPETPAAELAQLLQAARRVAASRVVVKRRYRAPTLPGANKPDWVVRGRSVRFDVYARVGCEKDAGSLAGGPG